MLQKDAINIVRQYVDNLKKGGIVFLKHIYLEVWLMLRATSKQAALKINVIHLEIVYL